MKRYQTCGLVSLGLTLMSLGSAFMAQNITTSGPLDSWWEVHAVVWGLASCVAALGGVFAFMDGE